MSPAMDDAPPILNIIYITTLPYLDSMPWLRIFIAALSSLSRWAWQEGQSQERSFRESLSLIVPQQWQALEDGNHLSILMISQRFKRASYSRICTNSAKPKSETLRPHSRFIASRFKSSTVDSKYPRVLSRNEGEPVSGFRTLLLSGTVDDSPCAHSPNRATTTEESLSLFHRSV